MRAYDHGFTAAATDLGLIKSAATHMDIPGTAPAASRQAKKPPFWAGVGADIKQQLIGDPRKYWEELSQGTWHRKGSFTRSRMNLFPQVKPGDPFWHKALAYAQPALTVLPAALGLYSAYNTPPEYRGEAYGRVLGGFAGSLAGAPVGVLGSMAGSSLGEYLGGSVGKLFNDDSNTSAYHDPRNPRYA